jgi:hypothetical protein
MKVTSFIRATLKWAEQACLEYGVSFAVGTHKVNCNFASCSNNPSIQKIDGAGATVFNYAALVLPNETTSTTMAHTAETRRKFQLWAQELVLCKGELSACPRLPVD